MKKYVLCLIFIILISALCICFVSAEEENNENTDDVVHITGEIFYETDTGLYCYKSYSEEDQIKANIMDGMVTTDKVIIYIPANLNVSVYKNGKDYELKDNSIPDSGDYVVNYMNNGVETTVLSFSILKKETGKIEAYRMPSNFAITEVLLNGVTQEINRSIVNFTEEGAYEVEYVCVPTEKKYSLRITIDHTPPTLKLEAVKNGSANGPVDISDLEKGAKMVVKRNGRVVNETGTLTKSGNYQIIISDAAGNTNQYQFTIQVYFNINSIVVFILIIVGIAALLIYIIKSRKGLKVR